MDDRIKRVPGIYDDDECDPNKVVVCEYAKYEAKCERRRPESVCLH